MRLVSPDRVLYVVADKAKLKALVEQLGGRGLGLPGMAAVARWSACVGMRRTTAPIGMACIAMVPYSHVTGVQWLAVQLLNWFDAHLLALHQRRKMRAILSLGGCSRTAPRWADTAVQLVQPHWLSAMELAAEMAGFWVC